jgi:quercetin dioxygenase-like cupin family protein
MPSRILNECSVAHFIDPQHLETLNVLGSTIQFLTSPDGSVPLHSHADPETFVMLSGSVEGLVHEGDDFTWLRVDPGGIFHVPCNAKHGWRNRGRELTMMLLITTGRLGRFLREVGKPATPGTPAAPPSPEEIAHLLKVSERYGYWNATPEENALVGL